MAAVEEDHGWSELYTIGIKQVLSPSLTLEITHAWGNDLERWILTRALHSFLGRWKKCTPDCSIIWRDASQKSGLLTLGREELVRSIRPVN